MECLEVLTYFVRGHESILNSKKFGIKMVFPSQLIIFKSCSLVVFKCANA